MEGLKKIGDGLSLYADDALSKSMNNMSSMYADNELLDYAHDVLFVNLESCN